LPGESLFKDALTRQEEGGDVIPMHAGDTELWNSEAFGPSITKDSSPDITGAPFDRMALNEQKHIDVLPSMMAGGSATTTVRASVSPASGDEDAISGWRAASDEASPGPASAVP
jgi:hypothetical protein